MQKIVIKHITGTKADQTETFEMPFNTLTFGRSEESCQVKYDPEKDDLVSRTHLQITPDNNNQFLLTDLNSSNGTFVNGQKVTESVTLQSGDTVQLGKDGPKFVFEMDPPPVAKKTRQAESPSAAMPTQQRETVQSKAIHTEEKSTIHATTPVKQGIGHATLERRVSQAETSTRKRMINISAGIFTVIALVVGYFWYQGAQDKQELQNTFDTNMAAAQAEQARQLEEIRASAPMSATEISRLYGPSTVYIETSWKLIHVDSGEQVYQTLTCIEKQSNGQCQKAGPVYEYNNGKLTPALNFDSGRPIGGIGTGTGFVVHGQGFILTNRHVAAGWETSYSFQFPGLLVCTGNQKCDPRIINENDPVVKAMPDWIPSEIYKQLSIQGKVVHGRHDFLEVTFPKSSLRIPANLVRVSDTADVALIKVDVPQQLQAVQIDPVTPVSAGDQITVMGYPGISPDVLVKLESQDFLNRRGEIRSVPEPTVTTGNVGKVFSNTASNPSESVSEYLSMAGDSYQLTVNATGPGNSGGPVFNDKGSVIGIFTAMRQHQGAMITFAVPIKHAQDIMGVQRTIN
ncbi:MAG: trypsin-like peptidase domain-containing protein [Burkholderiales bacterium]|nr:trypsin-like peptidase domain-containing protein [Burkholderiales bacterium]MDR4516988.1 trypsin-like peptidase domain-containing protein [Nitrosomonas sp.]